MFEDSLGPQENTTLTKKCEWCVAVDILAKGAKQEHYMIIQNLTTFTDDIITTL